jgi:hypothetical protein
MNADVSSILEPGEEVIWQGVSNRGMLLLSFFGFLVPILAMGIFSFTQSSIGLIPCSGRYTEYCMEHSPTTYYVNGAVLGFIIIGIGLILLVVNFLWQFKQKYTVTSKRVIMKSAMRSEYRSIYFSEIKGVLNATNWLDRSFDFGTVKIDTGATYPRSRYGGTARTKYTCLTNIDAPDKVYQYINSVIAKAEQIPA